jgi:hypothetical protein
MEKKQTETDTVPSYAIPTHADFLIAHSSFRGKCQLFTLIFPIEDICRGDWNKSDLFAVFALYKAQIKSDYKTEDAIGKII